MSNGNGDGWTTALIEDIASPNARAIAIGPFGSRLKADLYVQDGFPVIRGQDIGAGKRLLEDRLVFVPESVAWSLTSCIVREGDLIFPHRGAIGTVGIVGERPYLLSSSMMKLTCNRELVDPEYVFYYFRGPGRDALLTRASTVGTPGIGQPLTSLRGIPIAFPGLEQQRAIADVLGALDEKIEANTKLVGLLSDNLEAAFNAIVRDAESFIPFSELATVTKGVSYRSVDLVESKTALVTLKSFDRNGGYSSRGLKDYAGRYKPMQRICPGEVVVAQTDLTQAAEVVGRAIRVPESGSHEILVASLDLAIVRPVSGVPVEFMLGLMLQGSFRAHCRSRTSGTTVLHLASDAIPTFRAPRVSADVQQRYASIALPLLEMRDSLTRESESLAATRDALLPALMSGKLRVRDAEKVLEGVL